MDNKNPSGYVYPANFNEKLIDLISKYKILYDSKAEGYTNFQLQEEIWRRIGNELNEDVAACKLKWKNIRSSYTRYLRTATTQSGVKISKTYYLADKLSFLQPFCKRRSDFFASGEENNSFNADPPDLSIMPKMEPLEQEEVHFDEDSMFSEENNVDFRRIKQENCETSSEPECKKQKLEEIEDDPDLIFFKSLLPDIRKMNGKQKTQLKITILNAINSILYENNS